MLLRFLLPAWRFFEDFQEYPRLEFRHRLEDGDWSPWLSPPFSKSRHWLHLFLNSQGNFQTACRTLLENLVLSIQDLSPQEDIEQKDSFLLVKNWVQFLLRSEKISEYQFQVFLHSVADKKDNLVVISRIYDV